MSDPAARTFSSDFKRFFVRGLAVVLPSVLTLWIVVKAYQFVDSTIAEPINRGVRITMNSAAPYWEPLRNWFNPSPEQLTSAKVELGAINLPDGSLTIPVGGNMPPDESLIAQLRAENIQSWWARNWYMNFFGLIVAVVSVYVAGRLLGGYIGRKVYGRLERLITTVPVFKQVYPYVKQIVDFIFGEDKSVKFNRVVMVQYPRQGIWSLGFQTGPAFRSLRTHTGDAVSIFIPSSPTPFTGYTITVPLAETIELPLTVEEAVRYVVSGGVLVADQALDRPIPPIPDLIPIPVPAVDAEPVAGKSTRGTIAHS